MEGVKGLIGLGSLTLTYSKVGIVSDRLALNTVHG